MDLKNNERPKKVQFLFAHFWKSKEKRYRAVMNYSYELKAHILVLAVFPLTNAIAGSNLNTQNFNVWNST